MSNFNKNLNIFQLYSSGAPTRNHNFLAVSHSFTQPKQWTSRVRFTKTIRMFAPTLISNSSIVDKPLLHTTGIKRDLTPEALQYRSSCSFCFCRIPRGLGVVGNFVIQNLRPTSCFVQKTENSEGKDESLLKTRKCSVKNLQFSSNSIFISSFGGLKHLNGTVGVHRFCFAIEFT